MSRAATSARSSFDAGTAAWPPPRISPTCAASSTAVSAITSVSATAASPPSTIRTSASKHVPCAKQATFGKAPSCASRKRAVSQAFPVVRSCRLGERLLGRRLGPAIVVIDDVAQVRKRLLGPDALYESRRCVPPRPIDEALEIVTRDGAPRKHRDRPLSRAPGLGRQPGAERSLGAAE